MVVCHYRPVRMHMDLDTNMKLIGKRYPYLATYEVQCMVILHDKALCIILYFCGVCRNMLALSLIRYLDFSQLLDWQCI